MIKNIIKIITAISSLANITKKLYSIEKLYIYIYGNLRCFD